MSPAAARLRRRPHEMVHGEDMRLWRAEMQGYDGREDFVGRFKRAPVTPTTWPEGWIVAENA